jgi:hypothetical protein
MVLAKQSNSFWLTITDIESAMSAAKQGLWACAWIAGSTILLVVLNAVGFRILDFNLSALLDAGIFLFLGWGTYKLNRAAAVAGLALFIYERVAMMATHGNQITVLAVILVIMFINSVRGVFAYHKIRNQTSAAVA